MASARPLPRRRFAPLLATAFAAAGATAQTMTVTDLAQGATASFALSGGVPGNVAVLVLGFDGVGAGIPLDADALLDVTPPVILWDFALVPASGEHTFSLTLASDVPLAPISAQVIEASLFAPALDWRSSNAQTVTVAPISSLSDDFSAAALAPQWDVLNPTLGSAQVTGGELVLTPSAGGLPDMWFDDGEGLAVVRTVTGDFDVRCEVLVHDSNDVNAPPPTGYRLGGLLVRDGAATAPGAHEWCHVATGAGGAGQPTGVERKETHLSTSNWSFTPGPSTHRELRLVRVGGTITAWHRDVGAATWSQLATYAFPDLPATVQVGAMCYSFSSPPQVTARFAHVTFVD